MDAGRRQGTAKSRQRALFSMAQLTAWASAYLHHFLRAIQRGPEDISTCSEFMRREEL